jgi:ParB-like chromosome segregation protein Spo0J
VDQLTLLGTDHDKVIAQKLGRTRSAVTSQRTPRKISAFSGSPGGGRAWTDEELARLGAVTAAGAFLRHRRLPNTPKHFNLSRPRLPFSPAPRYNPYWLLRPAVLRTGLAALRVSPMSRNVAAVKTGRVRKREEIELVPLSALIPAKVNDAVYRPVDPADPAVIDLAAKVQKQGLLEPIVVTLDTVILSGHRRRVACQLAGVKIVKVRRHPIRSTDPGFPNLLVSFNAQRVKSVDEQIRETVVTASKADAYKALIDHRRAAADRPLASAGAAGLNVRRVGRARRRSAISPAKRPMLEAAVAVLEANREYWPLTVRQVHYRLLNDPPLRHANKPESRYANDQKCYSDLSDLLSRGRLAGDVSWESVHDPTRPQTQWQIWPNPGPFVDDQVEQFLRGYRRNLLQSQAAYYEIVGEKITVQTIIERVAGEYGMPCSIGRGYSSVDLRYQLAERFRASGKERLLLLLLNDFDPEGENITNTLPGSLRDEFGIADIVPVKVVLTFDQVQAMGLPPGGTVKAGSSRTKGFRDRYGTDTYELEALPPAELMRLLREAIEGVLDTDAFRTEQDREADDAVRLEAWRSRMRSLMAVKPD